MPIIITTIISFIAGIAIVIGGLGATDNLGSRGTMYQLNQFRSTSTPYSAITTNVSGKNLYMPDSTATTGIMYADTICLTGDTCETTWSAGGSQTPWTSDIDGGGYNLTNVDYITATGTAATSSFTAISIGTTTHAYALNVDGAIQTDTAFYGDYWKSSTGNSMAIQPTGDTDDFFSFKTPAHRPTIKREGGKFIYLESSNVYDVGISARVDDTYSGTLNYEKDNHMMTMLGKNSPLGFKANSDYDDYVKIQTASNIPEMTVASSSGFKINAGGTNALLLNHDGGNVGIGIMTPSEKLEVNGNIQLTPSNSYINGATGLQLKATADVFGDSSLYLRNRMGENGAIFEITGVNLVDFIFKHPGGQRNIRLEGRSDSTLMGTAQEWQFGTAAAANAHTFFSDVGFVQRVGNVGVGTTTPSAKLTVTNIGVNNSFMVEDTSGDTTPFVIDADGNVGIGDTTPSDKLSITNANATNALNIDNDGSGYTIYAESASTNHGSIMEQVGLLASTKVGHYVTTNSAQTTGRALGVYRIQNSSASMNVLEVDNDGTGYGLFLNQDGNQTALNIDSEATTTVGIDADFQNTSGDLIQLSVGGTEKFAVDYAGIGTLTGGLVLPTALTGLLRADAGVVSTTTAGSGDFLADGSVPMTADFNLDGNNLDNGGVLFLKEQADADADIAGQGQIWVNTATPNELWWTDDAGTDAQLGTGGGDVTDVFDCTTGDCNTMTVGTSEYLTYGTGYIDANRFAGVTTVDGTEFGYLNGVTSGIQTQLDAKSASFSTLAALNALIGETVASTTHVWADAYVNNDITIDLATLASSATALANARTIAGVSFDGSANIDIPSTGLSDTADLLYEAELNTFSELQTQIADETLLKAGTLTDTKYCIYDSASTDIICNSSGGSGVALGDSPSWTGAHDWKYAGTPVDIQNTTDAASNQVAIFRAGNRATPADNDQGYLSFYGDNDAGTQEEFGRLTWEMDDVSSTTKDSTLRFWTQTGNTMDSGMYLTGDNLSLDGNLNIGNNIISSTGHLSVNDYINVNGSSYVNTYIQNILSSAKLNISSSDSGIPANRSGALLNLGKGRWSEASSGNHPLIAGIAISPTTIDAGSATVSDTASLYIEGAATTTTVSGNNYSLWVDDIGGGGKSYIDGTLTLGNALPVGSGGTGATTLTDHGVLVGSGTSATTPLTVGTNGQILIGSTGADPVFATLNCDNALTCTTGAGTLEIDVDDSFLKNDGDTGTGTYNMSGATIKQHIYPTFMWLGVATTTTATTTVNIGTAYTAQQWNGMDCKVTSGSAAIIFSDCTNKMNGATATTTYNRTTLSTNNTFTAGESRCIDIGALTDAYPICTMDITINN